MIYDMQARTLTLDVKQCARCYGTGDQPTHITCPKCNGTQREPRGGRGGCGCYGGKVWDHDNRVPCDNCHGSPEGASPEIWTDTAPREALADIRMSIIRQNRSNSFNESYLGLGCLWSCVDYGRSWNRDETEVLADIADQLLNRERVQACKIVPDDRARDSKTLPVTEGLVVLLTRDGYSLRPVTSDPERVAVAEPSEANGLAIGMAVYNAGGNGTMAAAGAYLHMLGGE